MRIIVLLLTFAFAACGGSNDSFHDELRFGTSFVGFELVQESTSFSLALTSGTIAFRLESAAAFGDRFARLYIDSVGGSGSAPYAQKDYTGIEGHILLSTFRITDQGSYRVRSFLVEEIIDIGKETHVIDADLQVGP